MPTMHVTTHADGALLIMALALFSRTALETHGLRHKSLTNLREVNKMLIHRINNSVRSIIDVFASMLLLIRKK